ncbi:hypothetical protein EX30DRAFT_305569 [Ascodesmis nigricans]|uniref:Protein transport protein SEC31 n=1 Tax=Ascodesmis nigricans TaxID=341454 RepID=A0A4S2MZP8_9PEZI|nr:hypothetical protein EX30DRAFT_305569 [Ascodesmis nigricans]
MAKVRDIQRTAAFAWAPDASSFIATGTQAGAVSADFSDNTQLELWDLDLAGDPQAELSPITAVNTDSRFYDIAWGGVTKERPRGIIAGGLENGNALISQTKEHNGAIKALQFNHFSPNILATAGVQGELHIWNLENMQNTFRLGNKAARADDFDCLDWNKKVPHIVVTGGNGGFLTVWDVKQKRESLTLNNWGRKPASAVVWHPEQQTKLITAVPDDNEPVILVWDLKNSNAPERILRGHNGGVLSLSWCKQDPDLLLSCGKDNRTICWNPNTGEMLGEFPVVTNWTFKTSFNPRNPSYSATSSYDGKIVVRSLQNTNPTTTADASQSADADDFFSQASNAQASSFTLKQSPRWLKRPAGATFGFGGKLVSFSNPGAKQNIVKLSTVNLDSGVTAATEHFEKAVQEGNLVSICDEKAENAKTDEEKSEWKLLRALFENDTKAKVIEYLGFKAEDITPAEPATPSEEKEVDAGAVDDAASKSHRLSTFFGAAGDDSDNFLADLSIQSSQTARTNNPFKIYTGEESDAERDITKALVLGRFDKAVDVALAEDRMTDALMLAICGGEKCIERVKAAYFTKMAKGPNYLRLLASITGKNLWDVVHNADLSNWQEVMVALCTYAEDKEFGDLCETLGDRLEEEYRLDDNKELRRHASLCYLAGSKLHKVINIWITELHESEQAGLQESSDDSTFSVHARSLQQFIEKVTVFRQATKFVDEDKNAPSGWKLSALYEKYNEYADVVAAHGQLSIAEKYLDLLPKDYPAASAARERIRQATQKVSTSTTTAQARKTHPLTQPYGRAPVGVPAPGPQIPSQTGPYQPIQPVQPTQPTQPTPAQNSYQHRQSYAPPNPSQGYSSASPYAQNTMQPQTSGNYGAYNKVGYTPGISAQPTRPPFVPPPPKPSTGTANWNDTPEVVRPQRRPPSAAPVPSTSPFPGAPPAQSPQQTAPWGAPPPKATPPPPPKGALPPNRAQSPAIKPQSPGFSAPSYGAPPTQPNPYAPPPQAPPATGRYTPQPTAPAIGSPASPGATRPLGQGIPPPPQGTFAGRTGPPPSGPQYAPPPQFNQASAPSPYAPVVAPNPYAPPPTAQGAPNPYAPPPPGPHAPPMARPGSQQAAAPPPKPATPPPPPQPKHPKGDRTHIPSQYMPIFEILSSEMEKVKARAPPAFARQVQDTEKRLNILFDHLNNEEVLSEGTLEQMMTLSRGKLMT